MIHYCVCRFNSGILSYLLLAIALSATVVCARCVCVCALADYIYLDEDGCLQVWNSSVHDQLVLEQ